MSSTCPPRPCRNRRRECCGCSAAARARAGRRAGRDDEAMCSCGYCRCVSRLVPSARHDCGRIRNADEGISAECSKPHCCHPERSEGSVFMIACDKQVPRCARDDNRTSGVDGVRAGNAAMRHHPHATHPGAFFPRSSPTNNAHSTLNAYLARKMRADAHPHGRPYIDSMQLPDGSRITTRFASDTNVPISACAVHGKSPCTTTV